MAFKLYGITDTNKAAVDGQPERDLQAKEEHEIQRKTLRKLENRVSTLF